jgi:hypothetical protein
MHTLLPLLRPKFNDYFNQLDLIQNTPDEDFWRNAQAFTIQFTKFCQNSAYTALEVTRLFGSKIPVASYAGATFVCKQILVNASHHERFTLDLNKSLADEDQWRNAQAFTIQFTKFCQTCGYTAPEIIRLFGSKTPITSYAEAAFVCAQILINASHYEQCINGGLLCTEH